MEPRVIRPATDRDAAAVVSLIQELAAREGETAGTSEALVRKYLASPGSAILVADEAGGIVGLVSFSILLDLYHAGTSCLIQELVVRASHRGQGIGEDLIREVVDRARKSGCAEISVSTMPDNQGAQRFYRRLGFEDEAVFLEMHLDD